VVVVVVSPRLEVLLLVFAGLPLEPCVVVVVEVLTDLNPASAGADTVTTRAVEIMISLFMIVP